MNHKATSILSRGVFAALLISAVFAGSAGASPAWQFDGEKLSGSETIVGGAEESGMTVPGLTTTCDNFLYNISIENEKTGGVGDLEEVPLFDCSTDADACSVSGIEAEGLPWSTHLTEQGGNDYIFIDEVYVGVLYGGEECVLEGFLVEVTGSAGGLIDNEAETATFDASSFEATGATLEAFGEAVDWNGVFPTEAFEWHREDKLTVS